MTIINQVFDREVMIKANIGYKLFLPKHYDSNKWYPLILFLHGIKKRGTDIRVLDHYGLIKAVSSDEDFPFIVLAPQCPPLVSWPAVRHEVMGLLEHVTTQYSVDKKKIYLTGFSMGAHGVWDLIVNCPDHFSAAAPIAGWYEGEAAKLVKTPVWVFHGEEDDVVSISGSFTMVNALKEAGKEVVFTSYPGLKHEHDVMDITYANPELYRWLLQYVRDNE
ncbi:prolyl oligopeptidase family serine peptidase [Paenibacillus tarimensis]